MYYSVFFFSFAKFISTILTANVVVITSDDGPAYSIPSSPQNIGKIRRNGIRTSPCLAVDRIMPERTLPVAVK